MRALFQAQYLTGDVSQMRQDDYDSAFLVKALKGEELNQRQYSTVTIGGKSVRINNANKDETLRWFAEWAAPNIDALGDDDDQIVLIPIPNSSVTKKSGDFRTAEIARAVAAQCKAREVSVAPILRWKKPMTPSRKGGTRDKNELYPSLELIGKIPSGIVVLIDDVSTGRGHLIASAWKIEDAGREVDLAVCCGRTVHEQLDKPFDIPSEEIDLAR